MEYSMEAVSKRMIAVIVILSILVAVGGGVFYYTSNNLPGAFPFAMGAGVAMVANIIKVILLKRTVENAVGMDESKAKIHMQVQYFMRLMLMAGALTLSAFSPDNLINLMGTIFAIFSFPIAAYSVKTFMKEK